MNATELEKKFGVTAEDIEKWDSDAQQGILPGAPSGEMVTGPGRPMMFDAPMQQVSFKESSDTVEAMDRRADALGMRRSDYLRHLVENDLSCAGMV